MVRIFRPPRGSKMAIVYFDGHCNLCNGFVDFLIRRDAAGTLKFAPLQGKTAAERLLEAARAELSSVVLEDETGHYHESEAALRAIAHLGGAYALARALLIFPRFARDPVYRLVARNRYRLWGRSNTCRLPTPKERAHFLD